MGFIRYGLMLLALLSIVASQNGTWLRDEPTLFPPYMVDNRGHEYDTSPDRETFDRLRKAELELAKASNYSFSRLLNYSSHSDQRDTDYWFDGAKHGVMPLVQGEYTFYRNVRDFGARGNGVDDDTAALQRAASYFSKDNTQERCGLTCGSTTTMGALLFFPPGTYIIREPIVQYYYTQFVGDPNDPPTIKGAADFKGIALFDTDVYIEGKNGSTWYVNQQRKIYTIESNEAHDYKFYRQIRNFVFDLSDMKMHTEGTQVFYATGIHWQVAQATSLQNLHFNMPIGSKEHVGIFMDNGSGGFMSDLTFTGGFIGLRAGSQQYLSRNLQFNNVGTAISMIWTWGWVFQNIQVHDCRVAIDCQTARGLGKQGAGSLSIIDSTFQNIQTGVIIGYKPTPNIVFDNVVFHNTENIVKNTEDSRFKTLKGSTGTTELISWAMGPQIHHLNDKVPTSKSAHLETQSKVYRSRGLVTSDGKYFVRSRPQYGKGDTIVNVLHEKYSISNDGTGDQTEAINKALEEAAGKSVVFFPAGIYQVKGTVKFPVGSKIMGEGWSQIRGTGGYFNDEDNPKVMVQVGPPGSKGVMEISDMLFTVQGPTAGAILMQWNIRETKQGSAAMWDSHFRVGGAAGSNLGLKDCPRTSNPAEMKRSCMAASLVLHLTRKSSAYMENVWAWVADHDIDGPNTYTDKPEVNQINVYSARGILSESEGPTWLYATSSEHNVFYQYQFTHANNTLISLAQTETAYYQPGIQNPAPFKADTSPQVAKLFPDDPSPNSCEENGLCNAMAIRILSSQNIFIFTAGLYSFFDSYDVTCGDKLERKDCQKRIFITNFSKGIWVYNLFTIGSVEVVSPLGGDYVVMQNKTQRGYTTEVAVWIPLALDGDDIGEDGLSNGDIYFDQTIWNEPEPVLQCVPPCRMILPPIPLEANTTIFIPPLTTSIQVAWETPSVVTENGRETTKMVFVSVIQETTIVIPPVTTNEIELWNLVIETLPVGTVVTHCLSTSIRPPPIVITNDVDPESVGASHPAHTRTITPRPYPYTSSVEGCIPAAVLFGPKGTTTPFPPPPPITPSTISSTTTSSVPPPIIWGKKTKPKVGLKKGKPKSKKKCKPIPILKLISGLIPGKCGKPCTMFCEAPCLPPFCWDLDDMINFPDPILGPQPTPAARRPPPTPPRQGEPECETRTVKSCTTYRPPPRNVKRDGSAAADPAPQVECYPSEIGCGVEGEDADAIKKRVIPVNPGIRDDARDEEIQNLLGSFLKNRKHLRPSRKFAKSGILYWDTYLTPNTTSLARKNGNILSVTNPCRRNCIRTFSSEPVHDVQEPAKVPRNYNASFNPVAVNRGAMVPETGWRRQTDAPIHLSDINPEQGGDVSFVDPSSFYFHGSAGNGERGYVIDRGYRLEHRAFNGRVEFIPQDYAADIFDPDPHGNCMVDLIGGVKNGIAKKARIKVLKYFEDDTTGSVLEALADVKDDVSGAVVAGTRVGRAVLNLSLGFVESSVDQGSATEMYNLLRDLQNLGVLIVVAHGSAEDLASRHSYPQKFGIPGAQHVDGVLLVGAVQTSSGIMRGDPLDMRYVRQGEEHLWRTYDALVPHTDWISDPGHTLQVFAPGMVRCAGSGSQDEVVMYGTSEAAALVSGLSLYFWGHPSYSNKNNLEMKAHIIAMAYPRQPDLPNKQTIWNGYIVSDMVEVCPVTADQPLRRRGILDDRCEYKGTDPSHRDTGTGGPDPPPTAGEGGQPPPHNNPSGSGDTVLVKQCGQGPKGRVCWTEHRPPRNAPPPEPPKPRPAEPEKPKPPPKEEIHCPIEGQVLLPKTAKRCGVKKGPNGGYSFCWEEVIGNECRVPPPRVPLHPPECNHAIWLLFGSCIS